MNSMGHFWASSWFTFLLILHRFSGFSVAADQDGFLSLYCGRTSGFTDSSNITWVPDNAYVTTTNTTNLNFMDATSSSWIPLRFFPNSNDVRACYKLPMQNMSVQALVRPQFYYKNYDGLQKPPVFWVSIGRANVATVNLSSSDPWIEEFIWPVTKDTVSFCLHALPGGGFPVISRLEIRPLPQGAYKSGMTDPLTKSLRKRYRVNCGQNNGSIRYPFDSYDRVWDVDQNFSPSHLSTEYNTQLLINTSGILENPPVAVLQTARVLARKNDLTYDFSLDTLGDYYIVLYFAGILPVSSVFNIVINGEVMSTNFTVNNSEASVIFFVKSGIKTLNITLQNVSFYPQVSAIEVYELVDIPLESSSTTVSALQVIQQSTGLDLGWEDDPCSPTPWKHIQCEGSVVRSLMLSDISLRTIGPMFGDLLDLTTLDLHNTSLTGEIQNLGSLQELENLNLSFNQLTSFGSDFSSLTSLLTLDLKNNTLQGTVPDSVGNLKYLQLLNLENNKLNGALPQSVNRATLDLRTTGNLCLSFSHSTCNGLLDNNSLETPLVTIVSNKKRKAAHDQRAIIIGCVVGVLCALFFISLIGYLFWRKKKESGITSTSLPKLDMRNWNAARVLSYKEIKTATRNFKEIIGRGSFGSVYHGKLSDGKLVAVKVRLDRSQLSLDSFVNEVYLLSQVRHQNLVSLEGFCYESKQQILVYEYLSGGSLADNLYGQNHKKVALSWVRRLKIAVDAAKGLDYLHNGSDPRIIHRDIKCSNILLDSEMNAKVCDFGLSKQVSAADASHVTTVVKGTVGYIDPEYYSTQQLNEKSDVYSFGVVLLELICGREPLTHAGSPDTYNLVLWAKPYLQAGAFEIVDERIKGSYDLESMRKTASVASRAVERDASQRPTMAQVLAILKEAYSIQLSYIS